MVVDNMYPAEGDLAFIIEGSGTFSGHNQNLNAKSLELRGFDTIGNVGFQQFTSLVNVSFDESLLYIENNIFINTKVQNVYLPASLKKVHEGQSFDNFVTLKNIFVAESNKCFKDIDGVLYSRDQTILYYWPPNRNEKYIIVPYGVNLIWLAAFAHNSFTKYVRFPPTVRTIQSYFFNSYPSINRSAWFFRWFYY